MVDKFRLPRSTPHLPPEDAATWIESFLHQGKTRLSRIWRQECRDSQSEVASLCGARYLRTRLFACLSSHCGAVSPPSNSILTEDGRGMLVALEEHPSPSCQISGSEHRVAIFARTALPMDNARPMFRPTSILSLLVGAFRELPSRWATAGIPADWLTPRVSQSY